MSDEQNDSAAAGVASPFQTDAQAVHDIAVEVRVVLGRNIMPVSQLLKLGRGAVVELDTGIHGPVSLYVNNLLVARGDVVILDEQKLAVSVTSVLRSGRASG
jgi:flagellar motor switch protein FliN/FliY